jgi:drug/metabolite transporter (DMT)-like permease
MSSERRASSAFLLGAVAMALASVVFGAILVELWSRSDRHAALTGRLWVGIQLAWPSVSVVALAWMVTGISELRRQPGAVVAILGFAVIGIAALAGVWFQLWWIAVHEIDADGFRRFFAWTARAR